MHETQLARDLLRVVLERAQGARVLRVIGRIAETEALSPESLDFHFQAHAVGSVADGATLQLDLVHVTARCLSCGIQYQPEHHVTLCPHCNSTDAELSQQTGVFLDSLEVD